jgi:hypothetical protein
MAFISFVVPGFLYFYRDVFGHWIDKFRLKTDGFSWKIVRPWVAFRPESVFDAYQPSLDKGRIE